MRSKQEYEFASRYPLAAYETTRISYTVHAQYIPDFTFVVNGVPVYVELKQYLRYADCKKYEDVLRCNPGIRLLFLLRRCEPRALARLQKNFEVYVGDSLPEGVPYVRTGRRDNTCRKGKAT